MKAGQKPAVTTKDVQAVRGYVESRKGDPFVNERVVLNVTGPAPAWDRENFWFVLLGCLLTSQQPSTTGKPVDRFLNSDNFSLTLTSCAKNTEATVRQVLTEFGGIRFPPTIARRVTANLRTLEKRGWQQMESWFRRLLQQRIRAPISTDLGVERQAARFAAAQFEGIGPKQARNLWQWLGLTRYEIPLDSRVAKWMNKHLSIEVDRAQLSDPTYYEMILDYVQAVCARAGILPCVFDAAAFDNDNIGDAAAKTRGWC